MPISTVKNFNHREGKLKNKPTINQPWRLSAMNWDEAAGKWNQFKGSVKEKWGKLTDDDLTVIAGNRDQLIGKIQERYGITKEVAEQQVKEWKIPSIGSEETPKRKAS
jgi:uncharacterized protein YjbJ (UPF0337 family)